MTNFEAITKAVEFLCQHKDFDGKQVKEDIDDIEVSFIDDGMNVSFEYGFDKSSECDCFGIPKKTLFVSVNVFENGTCQVGMDSRVPLPKL